MMYINSIESDVVMTSMSSFAKPYDDLNGCFSDFCYATCGRKTVKMMKDLIKRDKLIGEVRRIQPREWNNEK